jgi:hypothetical protein
MALERFGTPVIDAVLRQKKGLGFTCAEHATKFDEMCESNLADGFLEEHPFGIYFSKKRDLLLFDIFKLIFIDNRGDYPSGLDIVDFLMMRSASHTVR